MHITVGAVYALQRWWLSGVFQIAKEDDIWMRWRCQLFSTGDRGRETGAAALPAWIRTRGGGLYR
jgi:hypothetical protein